MTAILSPVPIAKHLSALHLPSDMTYAEWEQRGKELFSLVENTMWAIGDWWSYGDRRFGESASQALDGRVSHQTFKNASWVAGKFEPSRRHPELSFSHHAEVASLEPEVADRLLELAEEQNWTREQIRAEATAVKHALLPVPQSNEVTYVLSATECKHSAAMLQDLRDKLQAELERIEEALLRGTVHSLQKQRAWLKRVDACLAETQGGLEQMARLRA